MSNYDGTGEKPNEGGDSAAFKGRRHPFLDRRIDWKAVDRSMRGGESLDAGLTDRTDLPQEASLFQLTGLNQGKLGLDACVYAVKNLNVSSEQWYVIRNCLIAEYRGAGPNRKESKKALNRFVNAVNQRLGSSGNISTDPVIGTLADDIARAENVSNPELSMYISVRHATGTMGPIGVCFTNTD